MRKSNWRNAPGPGDLWQPPEDDPDPDPIFVFRFIRPRIIKGALYIDERKVEVDEDHCVIEYARHVTRTRIWRWNRHEVDCVRRWAAKHPRVGPKYIAALEAL